MRKLAVVFCFWIVFLTVSQAQTDPPLLLRQPTVSRTQIVFTYAGDLWVVSRDGGEARRLTSALGTNTNARFSPDGSTIAFTGGYPATATCT